MEDEYENTLEYVRDCIEIEGFDYAVRYGSNFAEVKDEEFHKLLKAYNQSADELESYIENN